MKLYYEALKRLPEQFIHAETKAHLFTEDMVIAVNPHFAPIVFRSGAEEWEPIEFTKGSFDHMKLLEPCGREDMGRCCEEMRWPSL